MARVLVTGGNGQLGGFVAPVLADHELLLTDVQESEDVQAMDITDSEQVNRIFQQFKPDFLVHCAAYTAVDAAEEHPDIATAVNYKGTRNLAKACKVHGVGMIYISTDYVFNGTKRTPYFPQDTCDPLGVYGGTKRKGEIAMQGLPKYWILRTSWLFGQGNFPEAMLKLAAKMPEVSVVADQYGRPTWAHDLALAIKDFVEKQPEFGIYHVTGDGPVVSWAEFAEEIFRLANTGTVVKPIKYSDYIAGKAGQTIAPRPNYSALDLAKTKAAGIHLADWRDSLRTYLSK